MDYDIAAIADALSVHIPPIVRWCGAIAKRMRTHNISITGKESGYSNTDALTLADLTVQELLVAALRDSDPIFRQCRIDGEEETGDMACFSQTSELAIAIDPIDGTKQYRDRTGNGYSVIVQLQSPEDVHYSLVYIPENGPHGMWVEAKGNRVVCGEDDPTRSAVDVLKSLPPRSAKSADDSRRIYVIGFLDQDDSRAQAVTAAGLQGVAADVTPGSIYELMARGEFIGSLIHSPNIYDFPVSMQLARIWGGDAVMVQDGSSVNFHELWLDDRCDMLRVRGIVACSPDRRVLKTLCDVARDWNPDRYPDLGC
ncbi:MAG: inositol monophosphatase [Planctomycetota bacterium]|nr:inositol monophosphatase [Planctomycetota bacterium]